jgi:hypothetical protein
MMAKKTVNAQTREKERTARELAILLALGKQAMDAARAAKNGGR